MINEEWLYIYAKKMREAREFLKTKKLKFLDEESVEFYKSYTKKEVK